MAKSILVSSALPADALRIIPGEVTVDYNDTPAELSKAELIARLRGKDGLICHTISTIDDEVLAAAPTVKVVANVAVGYNNIDLAAARRRGVVVTNTPDVLTETTADFTWALLMATARRVVEADHFARSGQWQRWQWPLLWGAGLDVFEEEPKIHPGLVPLSNVVLAPHIASASFDTRLAMASLAVRNCLAVLDGKPALTPVP